MCQYRAQWLLLRAALLRRRGPCMGRRSRCVRSLRVVADSLLYILGRHMGWTILKFLCQVAVDPEGCVLRSAESFYKRGRLTLLFDKFIPGVSTMAAPLAGSMKMRFSQFLGLDFLGPPLCALIWRNRIHLSRFRGEDR